MTVLSEALKCLLNSDQPLTASSFTPSQRTHLDQFSRETRLIERYSPGRGTVYKVIDRHSLVSYLRQLHPLDDESLLMELPARCRNIGKDRNSKTGQTSHESCYLLMKAWDANVVWESEKAIMFPSELTERFGVAALQIGAGQGWQCNGSILLVENQALFDRCDWLPLNFKGCLAYYAGQLSDVLLHWFSAQKRSETVILFPDYDGIGLSNYVRLLDALHPETNLQFYWLPNWEDKLATFGNKDTWSKSRVHFENAIAKLSAMNALNDDFIKLARLSQLHGKALEQESIWLH
ncbi:hypothetical protein [Methylicorpusculum sp.]|uniref:hypothetical protein n=1 Tax=Methylicorpusculum sp. TaxID=2713644 RepID=UPI0027169B7F|nr:hypothetical protein [Methylicorpusculum sp.]MDO8845612.1 hypothetical protein [Methylicorpusculum sp.]